MFICVSLFFCITCSNFVSATDFVSVWNTSKISTGSSTATQVKLPLDSSGSYNFTVKWGDGSSSIVTGWNNASITHTYSSAGVYTINISGKIIGFKFNNIGDKLKLIRINQWGDLNLGNSSGYFYGTASLNITSTDVPNLTGTTNMASAFRESGIKFVPSMNEWNMSQVTDMSFMFFKASAFNQNISNWDTSNVVSMYSMFSSATVFNQPIGSWNTSSVNNMTNMFNFASAFNQNLDNWDTSNVIRMKGMFYYATSFNQPIGSWNTTNVIDMGGMFNWASVFNQNISGWDTTNVKDMSYMFDYARAFNQDISSWDTTNVKDMSYMFYNAVMFNKNISSWNTTNVTNMGSMFFKASVFNQDISSWDTTNVKDMSYMFYSAVKFNQGLGNWNVTNVTTMAYMFNGAKLSTPNYDNLLIGWANSSSLKSYVSFDAGTSSYCFGQNARNNTLIGVYNWSIIDGGKNITCEPLAVVITPLNNTYSNNQTQNFSVNITTYQGIKNTTFYIYNNTGIVNSTTKDFANETSQTMFGTVLTLVDNTYSWFYDLFDSNGKNYTTSNNTLTIDTVEPTCVIVSRTPTDINDSSTGIFSVIINCTDPSGLNVAKVGDHYPFFVTRTVDSFILTSGVPNYWSNRYPNNSLGVSGTLTPPYQIWRALGRNEGDWYENLTGLSDCTGLSPCYQPLNDTFSYAIEDGRHGHFSVTNGSTWALINYTHPAIELAAFRQSVYLSYEGMVKEDKKNQTISSNNPVLLKRFDADAYRGTLNYKVNYFRNLGYTGNPGQTLKAYYCNSSYNPAGSTKVASSPNCMLFASFLPADLNPIFTDSNSSYALSSYSITDGRFGGIIATAEYYVEYETTQGSGGTRYFIKSADGPTSTGRRFNDTKVAWTSTDGGTTWTQAAWTPDVFTTSVRGANDEVQFGGYICDLAGNCFKNFNVITDAITPTNHPISNPDIFAYNSSANSSDVTLNATHSGIMNIGISCSKDPDSVGNVTHNLTLRNLDNSLNYVINTSFKCVNDTIVWVNFNTSQVLDGKYKMNLFARSGDNPLDTKNITTTFNFTIDNIPLPAINVIEPKGDTEGFNEFIPFGIIVNNSYGVSFVKSTITKPDSTNEEIIMTPEQQNDSFQNDSQWFVENSSVLSNQTCIATIGEGKAMTTLFGDGTPSTDVTCSLVGNRALFGDFELIVNYNITNLTLDSAINFQISSEQPTSSNATTYAYIGRTNFAGEGNQYQVFGGDTNTSGFLIKQDTNDSYGAMKIRRINNNFSFYVLNNSDSSWILLGNEIYEFHSAVFAVIESENINNNWGTANVSWTNFTMIELGVDEYVAVFSNTSQAGTYAVTFFANDSFNQVNNYTTAIFRINDTNSAPSTPFVTNPVGIGWYRGNVAISWSAVSDLNNDLVAFNISLLNPDKSFNQTIISNYGDLTTTSYDWDTSLVPDGNYSLSIEVKETLTSEKYSKSDTLSGDFIIDNTNPNATLLTPVDNFYNNTHQNFTVNLTDNIGLKNATLNIYNSTELVNQTAFTSISGSLQSTIGVVVVLIDGSYDWFYKVFDLTGNSYSTENNTVTLNFCTPNLVNTSWSDWTNTTCSLTQMNQSRYLISYDNNTCGEVVNTTIYDYQLVGPTYVNGSWSDWTNLSCLFGDEMNQVRNLTQFDIYGCSENQTLSFEYRAVYSCDYCTPVIVNTNKTEWQNQGACLINDTQVQNRSWVEYDNNTCGEVENVTYFETNIVACDYCTPNMTNTNKTEWQNQGACLIDNTRVQNRSWVNYDSNYCGEILDTTYFEYQNVSCDFCTPSMINTSWSDWTNTTCSLTQMNQSRYLISYDNNRCGESPNTTIYDYQLVGPTYVNTSWSDWTNISCLSSNFMNQSRNLTEFDIFNCGSNMTHLEYQVNGSCVFLPLITSYIVSPSILINGSNVSLFILSSNYNDLFAEITLPDSRVEFVSLTNGTNTTFGNTSLIGTYNVVFYANNSNGIVNATTYFTVQEPIEFEIELINSNLSGINSTLNIYYQNGTIASNQSLVGNYSLGLPSYIFGLEYISYDNQLRTLLREVNISLDNNKSFGLDNLLSPTSGYLVTYGVKNLDNISFTNITLTIYYGNLSFSNEDNLRFDKCDDWNFTAQVCNGGWRDITSSALQDKTNNYFEVTLNNLSGFSIREVVSSSGSSSGGGGSGGTCISNWNCTNWSACTNGKQTRNCTKERTYCYIDINTKPQEIRTCTIKNNTAYVPTTNVNKSNLSSPFIPELEEVSKTVADKCCLLGTCWFKFIICWYYWVLILLIVLLLWSFRRIKRKRRYHSHKADLASLHLDSPRHTASSLSTIKPLRSTNRISSHSLIGKQVITDSGTKLGIVEEVLFETKTGEIIELELKGLKGYNRVPFDSVISIGDFIVISQKFF